MASMIRFLPVFSNHSCSRVHMETEAAMRHDNNTSSAPIDSIVGLLSV